MEIVEKFTITPEEEKELIENRKKSPYLKEIDEGEVYPIPHLVGGFRSVLVDKDTMNAEDLTFGYCKFEPNSYHEKHSHSDCEEIMYILSGKGVGGVGDHETIQQAGDVIFVPRGAVHWFYNPFDEPQIQLFVYTRSSLAKAGYSLESQGYKEIGSEVEKKKKSENKD